MPKNIFLTGDRSIGKSTLLGQIITSLNVRKAGFRTVPDTNTSLQAKRFFITPVSSQGGFAPAVIGEKLPGGGIKACTDAFETTGAAILRQSLDSQAALLIMDELGFLEQEACQFQSWVLRCLDSPLLVIGVIKPLPHPFLDSIRARKDVELIEVTRDNRESLAAYLPAKILQLLDSKA